MRKLAAILIFTLAAGALIAGCSQNDNPVNPAHEELPVYLAYEWEGEGAPCGEPVSVSFIAGQNFDAGTVSVTLDGGFLCITIETANGWVLDQTHVAVASDLDSIPQTGSGNPKVGKFLWQEDHVPPVTSVVYCCNPLDYIWQPGEIYIAVHAEVSLLDEAGDVIQEETAWAEGLEFPGRSWATYFTFAVEDCNGGGECPILLISPNGGEALCLGFPWLILWDLEEPSTEQVKIELLLNDEYCMTIAEAVDNIGEYEWIIESCGPPEGYKIRVTALGCGGIDESDEPFYIDFCGPEKR